MKAIVIDPGTEPVVKTVPETLQALGAMSGGACCIWRARTAAGWNRTGSSAGSGITAAC